MADTKKMPIILKITRPDGSLHDAVVEAEQVIVGSGPSAGVKIEDPKVSSLHFMLKVDKNGVVNALDLGSEHGTVLGGKKIIEPTALASGDTLSVGDHKIRIAYGAGERTDIVTSPGARPPSKSAEAARPPSKPAEAVASAANSARPATKPPPAPVEAKDNKADNKAKGKQAKKGARSVGTIGATAMLFNEELPAEETPSDDSKVLEVAQLWGDTIINIGTYPSGEVTVGSEKPNHFHVFSDKVGPAMVLVRAEGSTLLVTVPDGADVVFRSSRSQKTREQLQGEGLLSRTDGAVKGQVLKLALHDRALVSIDNVAFVVRWVRPQKALPLGNTLDFYFTKVLSVTFMAFLAAWWAVKFTDLGASALSDDLFKNASKYQKIVVAPPAKEVQKKILDLSGVKEGAKAQKEEGKFGKIEAKKQDADPSKKGAPKVDPNKREEDRMKVAKAGMLGALSKLGDDATSNVLGPGGMGTGINNALGGLKGGAGMGDAHGVGGLGSRGTGPGGGGTGLGLGGLGTKGSGHGRGGYGQLDLGGKGKDTVRVVPGKTTVVGALSREEIERVIKRHENEILFCYKTELNKDPNLYGKVAVNFTIDGSGAIADAQVAQTTMNNNNVEQCMLSRIRRWRFPEPKGGGQVVVTYPWILRSAEGGGDE